MRPPAQFRLLLCACERATDHMLLTYSSERGFFEPITNLDAEPVVGKVLDWRYAHMEMIDE